MRCTAWRFAKGDEGPSFADSIWQVGFMFLADGVRSENGHDALSRFPSETFAKGLGIYVGKCEGIEGFTKSVREFPVDDDCNCYHHEDMKIVAKEKGKNWQSWPEHFYCRLTLF